MQSLSFHEVDIDNFISTAEISSVIAPISNHEYFYQITITKNARMVTYGRIKINRTTSHIGVKTLPQCLIIMKKMWKVEPRPFIIILTDDITGQLGLSTFDYRDESMVDEFFMELVLTYS